MKKPIHLYIFVVLSSIATIMRLFGAFVPTFDEANVRSLFQGMENTIDIEETITVLRETAALSTNGINKAIAIISLLVLIGAIVFLFQKKNELASYTYLGYLFVAFLFNTYNYIASKNLFLLYSDELVRQTSDGTALGSYIVNIVIFAVYVGVTAFFLLRKPKEKPSTAINSTDI